MFTLRHLFVTALGAMLSLAATTALADPDPVIGYQEDWNDGDAQEAGWSGTGGTGECLSQEGEEGSGYLRIMRCGEGDIGADYLEDELSGDFGDTEWIFSVDLQCIVGTCTSAQLILHTSEGVEEFTLASGNFGPSWATFEVSFDAPIDHVNSTEVRIAGEDAEECDIEDSCSFFPLTAGMDNVTLELDGGILVTQTLVQGPQSFDLGFVQVDVDVRDVGTGTETYQFCVAEVPDWLDGKLFAANLLRNTGTCGDFDLGGLVPPTVRFFRDELDNGGDGKLKVGVMRVDSDATYDGLYQQVLTESFLSQAPLSCLSHMVPPADQPRTMVFDAEDFGAIYNNSTGECNQPVSLGRKRSTYLSPVKPMPSVAAATVGVGVRIASLYIQLHRASLPTGVKRDILRELNAASVNFLKKRFGNLIGNFNQIARIAVLANDTNDTENWLGLFWGQGLIGAFETSEGILGQIYTIPGDLEPFPVFEP